VHFIIPGLCNRNTKKSTSDFYYPKRGGFIWSDVADFPRLVGSGQCFRRGCTTACHNSCASSGARQLGSCYSASFSCLRGSTTMPSGQLMTTFLFLTRQIFCSEAKKWVPVFYVCRCMVLYCTRVQCTLVFVVYMS
jgi:hypothetical protein